MSTTMWFRSRVVAAQQPVALPHPYGGGERGRMKRDVT